MAYPIRYFDMMKQFPRSKQELSVIFNDMLSYIFTNFGDKLTNFEQPFLSMDKVKEYATAINDKGAPLRRCWGFLDGTVRPICRPLLDQREFYNGHKRTHAQKFQSLMIPNGIIANLFGPYHGRRHDSALLTASGLLEKCEKHMTEANGSVYYLYGDLGYPIRRHLLTPYKGDNLTPQEMEFNGRMSHVREAVEWGFGKVVQTLAFLDFKKNLKVGLQPTGQIYVVGILLGNCHTCLYGSQTGDYFNLTPPPLEEYLG